jgi:hypothetical protein
MLAGSSNCLDSCSSVQLLTIVENGVVPERVDISGARYNRYKA